jgi:hypothetical protein
MAPLEARPAVARFFGKFGLDFARHEGNVVRMRRADAHGDPSASKEPRWSNGRSGVAVVTGRTCPDFNRMEADMTTLSGTKLTDTQLIALSGAAQRQDGAVSLPERIKGMAAQKLATSLMDKGIVREIRAKPGMPAWRRDEDGRTYALVITKLGRAAICVADDGKTRMDAVKDNGLPSPRSHKGRRPLASALEVGALAADRTGAI